MNTYLFLQTIIVLFEALSEKDRVLLFDLLHQWKTDKQHQENGSENPWIRLAGKYQNDLDYDEVLAYIQEYRRELDAEIEVG